MNKIPFTGRFCGSLIIGEERAKFDGEMLVSYYAKPFCSNANVKMDKCIEFKNDMLIIQDVESPDSEEYSCIWHQEDIENVLDDIGYVAAYGIKRISCNKIRELRIPADCLSVSPDAFNTCPRLKKIICLGDTLFRLNNDNIRVVSEYDDTKDYHYIGVIKTEDRQKDYGLHISKWCDYIERADVKGYKRLCIQNRTLDIDDEAIDKGATILCYKNSSAEKYAKKFGNKYRLLDGSAYDSEPLPDGFSIENGILNVNKKVRLKISGTEESKLNKLIPGERLSIQYEPDEMNSLRVVFRNASTEEYLGLLANRAAYTASYLINKGFLAFENVFSVGKGFVTADLLWNEPVDAKAMDSLRVYEMTKEWPNNFWARNIMFLSGDGYYPSSVVLAGMEFSDDKVMTNDIMMLSETNNRLSCSVSEWLRGSLQLGTGLSALRYSDSNRYDILFTKYSLEVDPISKSIRCLEGLQPIKLNASEEEYAQIYINHYRRIYNLPPIHFESSGGENCADV